MSKYTFYYDKINNMSECNTNISDLSYEKNSNKPKIIGDLVILASITPGKTFSPSSMSIIDHNSWSTTFYRRYNGENRKNSIAHIRGIFIEALNIYSLDPCNDIIDNINEALKGILNLKETYKGDYYTIAEIDRIVNETKEKLESFKNNEYLSFEDCVHEMVQHKMMNNDIEVKSQGDLTSKFLDEMISNEIAEQINVHDPLDPIQKNYSIFDAVEDTNFGEMVETSDRTGISETTETTFDVSNTSNCAESSSDMYPINLSSLNDEQDLSKSVAEDIIKVSDNTIQAINDVLEDTFSKTSEESEKKYEQLQEEIQTQTMKEKKKYYGSETEMELEQKFEKYPGEFVSYVYSKQTIPNPLFEMFISPNKPRTFVNTNAGQEIFNIKPPIVRLALNFKKWFESINDDENYEYYS